MTARALLASAEEHHSIERRRRTRWELYPLPVMWSSWRMQATTASGFFCFMDWPDAVLSVWMAQRSSSCRSMPVASMTSLITPRASSRACSPALWDVPCLSRIYETFGVVRPGQDHSGEEFNPVRCFCCGGSCHGQSASSSHRWTTVPVGHLQDWRKQRQHLGQRLRVTPVSGRKNRYELHEIAKIIGKEIIPHQQQPKNKHWYVLK